MISCMRERVLALACVRHQLPSTDGRGIDKLPRDVLEPLKSSYVGSIDIATLWPAFRCVTEALIREARNVDAKLAKRLTPALLELTERLD